MIASQILSTLTFVLLLRESAAWTYGVSTSNMTYDEASAYCQQRYTHLVAIQNKEEIEYLNATLSYSPSYYWIGIRKVNGVWVWVGTQKPLTKEAENWAPGEPNNKQNNEDCVEIYIKRPEGSGMWNDERCSKRKLALCYTAACNQASCSGHGECIETINNYTCRCQPGFRGLECEQVVTCEAQKDPEHGRLDCTAPFGTFSYSSSCSVSCDEGYLPSSTETSQCTFSGEWSAPPPTCKVVECDALAHPPHGTVDCGPNSGSVPWNTTCAFDCEEGFERVGAQNLKCTSTGSWDDEKLRCKAVTCEAIPMLQNGSVHCVHSKAGELTFKSSCKFTCDGGFRLLGPAQVECTAQGQWSQQIPVCAAFQCAALSSPERGHVNCLPSASGGFQNGSSCRFSCEPGFALKGSERLECGPTGEWDSEKPACEAVQCAALSAPRNGSVRCTPSPTGKFPYKSSCTFHCEDGFDLHGSAQLECTSQGQWTHEVPSCQVVQCSSLAAPGKVNVSCSGEPVAGTVCEFACPEGWTLNGSAALTCGATGHWSGTLPTCEALPESNIPLAAGLSAAGTSLLTVTSVLLWLRKKARKFVPASCQSLESYGNYQMPSDSI
ncbi:E-selectin-like isoform X2 [Sciurus carolinensis]|uniref:E-selectin-like isoform X2 n=1 Tax=Sciurus carolinensis TaxID=30640 RepID=UPI001FB2FE59|nr:E-selectin-like isoform X2 [Sciurus carolinensis]XP_047375766.1 E-selectin-like isoform X2 [Sciurus carolinensis]